MTWVISRTYGPHEPVFARRMWVAVMVAGAVLTVAAAVMLVAGHDPDRLYLSKGGYLALVPALFAYAVYFLINALTLIGLRRTRPRDLAAAYAGVNAVALLLAVPTAVGPWLTGSEPAFAGTIRAAVLAAAWIALA